MNGATGVERAQLANCAQLDMSSTFKNEIDDGSAVADQCTRHLFKSDE